MTIYERALEMIRDGMIVGLGSGRASTEFIKRLGAKVKDGLKVKGVPTSEASDQLARQLDIPLVGLDEALALGEEKGFDLVEVSPEAKPPVVKLMDYGKYKYEQQKKAAEARKKQRVIEIKEIKMRPTIDDHDYDTKMKQMRRFFDEGDKVKVTLR